MAQHLIEHSFLFTNEEREAIYRASSDVDTRPVSFVTRLFLPLWRLISVRFLSDNVAPNAITALGLLSSLQAYQLISTYYHYGEGNYQQLADVYPSLSAFGVRGAGQTALGVNIPGTSLDNITSYGWGDDKEINFPDHYDHFFHANRTVQTATALAWLLLIVSVVCASVDGVHAKRCRLATSLGDIFARVCSSLSRIFTALTMLEVMQLNDIVIK